MKNTKTIFFGAMAAIMMSVGAAQADIASKKYVDDVVDKRELSDNKMNETAENVTVNAFLTSTDAADVKARKAKFPTIDFAKQIADVAAEDTAVRANWATREANGTVTFKKFFAPTALLEALNQESITGASACNDTNECALIWNGTSWSFEPIARDATATTPSDNQGTGTTGTEESGEDSPA